MSFSNKIYNGLAVIGSSIEPLNRIIKYFCTDWTDKCARDKIEVINIFLECLHNYEMRPLPPNSVIMPELMHGLVQGRLSQMPWLP
jgi:hypothetical protein